MRERSVTISGMSKTYAVTGWRVGTMIAPPHLTHAFRQVHDYVSIGAAAPLQEAGAVAYRLPRDYYDRLAADYQARRDRLCSALLDVGFDLEPPQGAYYVMADITAFGADRRRRLRPPPRPRARRRDRPRLQLLPRQGAGPPATSGSASASRKTEGPFYPNKLPLDTDNDLLIVNDAITPAVGEITHLDRPDPRRQGRPDPQRPGRDLAVRQQRRLPPHRRRDNGDKRDKNFQGFGRFLTGSTGEYYFRTIKPVPYPGRTPHIHFKIKQGGKELLTTQCYIKGDPGNDRDGVYRGIRDPKARDVRHRRLRPDQGLEDRRARGQVRHRPGRHAGGVSRRVPSET